jgi:hypothetical protein
MNNGGNDGDASIVMRTRYYLYFVHVPSILEKSSVPLTLIP